uniref:Teneurin-like YD-shell domain-containing protein n=1 Tax=Romanomermis culicivorax TaxID=13658 RepID=A0A915I962_ROMCU
MVLIDHFRSGRITNFANFKYEYFDAKILCFNQHLSIETNLSPNNQPSVQKISIRNRPIVERRSLFDAQNRLVALTFKLSDNGVDRQISRSYDYDDQNRLIAYNLKIDDSDQKNLIFKYDDAGNLLHTVDPVVHDSDGFLIKRGDFTFEYDGLNRLIRSKSPKIDNRYFYDHENRVIGYWRGGRGLYQFWYTTATNRIALAKLPDQSSMTFYYDPNFDWSLIGLEKSGIYYAVVDDPDGTPVFIFNFDGALVSRTVRTPIGALEGAGAEFYLPIGFKGRFQDPDADVVIMDGGRSYDAMTERYMSLDIPKILKVDFLDLDSLNGHIFNGNDPVNLPTTENLPLETENWLNLIGYKFQTTPPIFPSPFKNDFRSISYNNIKEKDTVASESSFIGLPAFGPSYRNWTMSNTAENGKNILIWTDLSAINLRYGHKFNEQENLD